MKWLQNLFTVSNSAKALPSGDHWYSVASTDGTIGQVVLSLSPECVRETEFGTFFLNFDRFPLLASQPWCAGVFRLDGNRGPYCMARVDKFANEAKGIGITLAFSFCRMKSSGLLHMAVRFDSKPFRQVVTRTVSVLPPIEHAMSEWITSLDSDYDQKMISDLMDAPELRLVVCENSNSQSTIFDQSGRQIDMVPPMAAYEAVFPLVSPLATCLKTEWAGLIAHHEAIPSSRRNFSEAQRELSDAMPTREDPILPRR